MPSSDNPPRSATMLSLVLLTLLSVFLLTAISRPDNDGVADMGGDTEASRVVADEVSAPCLRAGSE